MSRIDPARYLLVTHRVPYPPDKGDRIRSYHVLVHLAKRGRVDLAYLTDLPVGAATRAALRDLCHRVEAVPIHRLGRWFRAGWSLLRGRSLTAGLFRSPRLAALLGRWLAGNRYDAVICFSSGVLPPVLDLEVDDRLVVDLVDVDSQKWQDYATRSRGFKAWLFALEARRVRALERQAARARVVVLATDPEADLYRAIEPSAVVESIANGVDLDFFRPTIEPRAASSTGDCVFIGQLDYRANVVSLEWFCREVWPFVLGDCPGAILRLVGRNPTRAVRRLATIAGVEVIGPVADVRPWLAAARVVVVPLMVARGVQNKVLEAMAAGRAVVASPGAVEGLAVVPGREVLVATTPAEWARAIARLRASAADRDRVGRAARAYVEGRHRWDVTLSRFDPYLGPADLDRAPPPPAAGSPTPGSIRTRSSR